jgi:hypothetical protein
VELGKPVPENPTRTKLKNLIEKDSVFLLGWVRQIEFSS